MLITFLGTRKKVIQIWDDIEVNKWWQVVFLIFGSFHHLLLFLICWLYAMLTWLRQNKQRWTKHFCTLHPYRNIAINTFKTGPGKKETDRRYSKRKEEAGRVDVLFFCTGAETWISVVGQDHSVKHRKRSHPETATPDVQVCMSACCQFHYQFS